MSETNEPKIALVTGAGRGIGREIALKLAQDGHTVICVSKSEGSCGSAAEFIKEQGLQAVARAVDVSKGSEVADAAAELLKEFGNIDILVNNAGITRDTLLFRMSDEDWDAVLQTNLSSSFYWTKHLARPMTRKRWGRIINISSVVGLMGNAGQANYAAAKAGMIGLTKSLAREFAARKVTVNAVAPGFIDTDMTADLSEEVKAGATGMIPLKRFGEVGDIASIVSYLASEQSSYITGQTFTVDGGMVM
ncbi:MAG: 3-oxoacyl-[acyl-carrier-protein] reductase [Verrucomicrobiota bacterium]